MNSFTKSRNFLRAASFLVALGAISFAAAQEYVPGRVLVQFREGAESHARIALRGARLEGNAIPALNVQALELPAFYTVPQALEMLRSNPNVAFAEPDWVYRHTSFTPNDPGITQQYTINRIQANLAWAINRGDPGVIIAIADTGVSTTHPDLVGKLVAGRNFVSNNTNTNDDHGHGTHCAGIAAANTNNGIGVAGIGFDSRIMPIKVLGSSGSGSSTNIANGIIWAADNGAKVISLSLGSSGFSTAMENAVNYAWNKNVVVVGAAGNSNVTTMFYPAGYANSIAVASTTNTDARSSFSNYGNWVDVAAPGSSIYSTLRSGGYGNMSGTSMACPNVAGLAGLVWSHLGINATNQQVRERIENNTDNVGTFVAKGRVNAYKALVNWGATNGNPSVTDFPIASGTGTTVAITSGSWQSLANSDGFAATFEASGKSSEVDFWVQFNAAGIGQVQSGFLSLRCTALVPAKLNLLAWDWNANRWNPISTIIVSSSFSTQNIPLPATMSNYFNSQGQVRVRLSTGPKPDIKSLRIDSLRLNVTRN